MEFRSCWFPLTIATLMTSAVIVAYIIAALLQHVASIWPYISDDGVKYPERNIFAQLLDVAAFFGIISISLRYLIVQKVGNGRHIHLARVALVLGVVSSFALTLIGNFQENLGDYVHDVGALLMFVLGTVFVILDAIITYKIRSRVNHGTLLTYIRCIIAAISIIFIILFGIGKILSEKIWNAQLEEHMYWCPGDPGYSLHILGSASEWVLAFMFVCYFASFVHEFSIFKVSLCVDYTEGHQPLLRSVEPQEEEEAFR